VKHVGSLDLELTPGLTEVPLGRAVGPAGCGRRRSQVVMGTQIVWLLKHAGLWS